MRKILWVAGCVLAALLIAAAPASAAVKEGDKEIAVYGSMQSIKIELGGETATLNVLTLQLTGGFFVSDAAQVGGSFTQQTFSNDFTVTNRMVGGFFKFHFNPKETVVPYVGAQVGLTTTEFEGESDSSTSYGPLGGIKFFISENLSVNPEASLTFAKIQEADVTITTVQVGLAYYF